MQCSVPAHGDALDRLRAALADDGCAGAVVLGPDGVGKSTLARLAADDYAAAHPDAVIRRVTGTPTESAVPFGAFSRLVDVADIGKPAALLRAARESLRASRSDVLIVDDAHQLDPLSATLVYQLALAGQTRMAVTARADAAPQPIAALWDDQLLCRIDIESDSATTGSGDIEAYLAELPDDVRTLLDHLAVQEPIPLADVITLVPAEAVHEAQRLGAVEVLDFGDGAMVYTAHPLFAERSRAALGADGARPVATRLVPLARARARDHPADRLRLAGLALGSDAPQSVEGDGRRRGRGAAARGSGPGGTAGLRRVRAQRCAGAAAAAGARTGLAGQGPRGRRRAGRGGSRGAVRTRPDGVGPAAGRQPVLDAGPAGAGDGLPAYHPQPADRAGGADHDRRVDRDVRDERR